MLGQLPSHPPVALVHCRCRWWLCAAGGIPGSALDRVRRQQTHQNAGDRQRASSDTTSVPYPNRFCRSPGLRGGNYRASAQRRPYSGGIWPLRGRRSDPAPVTASGARLSWQHAQLAMRVRVPLQRSSAGRRAATIERQLLIVGPWCQPRANSAESFGQLGCSTAGLAAVPLSPESSGTGSGGGSSRLGGSADLSCRCQRISQALAAAE
jgi:hypothetical protein